MNARALRRTAIAAVGMITIALLGLTASASTSGPEPMSTPLRVTIYRVRIVNGAMALAPVAVTVPANRPAILYAVNSMAARPDSPLPPGTQALDVTIDDKGIATLDLNAAFLQNFRGGDEAEAMAVLSLMKLMGQFHGIGEVLITVDGQPVDSLGGHIDLSEPIEVAPERPRRYEHRKRKYHAPKTIAFRCDAIA